MQICVVVELVKRRKIDVTSMWFIHHLPQDDNEITRVHRIRTERKPTSKPITQSRSVRVFTTNSHMLRKASWRNCCTGTSVPSLDFILSCGAKASPPQKQVLRIKVSASALMKPKGAYARVAAASF